MREVDAVGRYGGDKFIALFSDCNLDTADAVCERIRHFVADTPIATPAGPITATVSIGLVECNAADADQDQIIGAADAALYRAKDKGRNRVET